MVKPAGITWLHLCDYRDYFYDEHIYRFDRFVTFPNFKFGVQMKNWYVVHTQTGLEEKVKTLIHELMHIPKAFGGGFRHHDVVNRKNVENLYKRYAALKT